MNIQEWLSKATQKLLEKGINTARLEALILLSDELGHDKAWVLAHTEFVLSNKSLDALAQKLARRLKREPLAYIRGTQEFFGRSFMVAPGVLIPRPETEDLITTTLSLPHRKNENIIDIGTGSGCIAITLKLSLPESRVFGTDISSIALAIAERNAQLLGGSVHFSKANLLSGQKNGPFHFILANLPYVAKDWHRSPETSFEPDRALFAEDDGCARIKELLVQAPRHLIDGGYLIIEADPRQHKSLVDYAIHHDFMLIRQEAFCLAFQYSH